ncbi:Short-chain dehydrogenase [Epibacterium ulvae]|uniref:Short-chain dehydrogenase n=1 Tax=Epibacterium ulvae TaxID=1156985 RepID=A0A1G5R339_9RHOB|nr:SDR family oxidoreductase [Epibacterium ulvae]SCZ68230.1 Short-chain dehydrogenase [Epibacterium ulvae]
MSKIILVTGTSTGLGISIAVQAAKAGHIVYATMRNLAKREELDVAAKTAGVVVNVMALDVQSPETIAAAVEQIIQEHGRIDTLVNNAGSGFVRNIEQAGDAEIQQVMDVNFMGVVRCTRAVLPQMRAKKSGHVINISSVGGLVGQPFNEIYCGAKFAVEGFTEALASYVTPGFGINFTTIEPGGIATEFSNNVLKQVAETGGMLDDDYLPLLQKYVGGSQNRQDGSDIYQTADQVAEVVMKVIDAEHPPLRTRTSAWSEEFTKLKTGLDPDGRKQRDLVVESFLN